MILAHNNNNIIVSQNRALLIIITMYPYFHVASYHHSMIQYQSLYSLWKFFDSFKQYLYNIYKSTYAGSKQRCSAILDVQGQHRGQFLLHNNIMFYSARQQLTLSSMYNLASWSRRSSTISLRLSKGFSLQRQTLCRGVHPFCSWNYSN